MREFLGLSTGQTGPFPHNRLGNIIATLLAVAVFPATFIATGHLHAWQRLDLAVIATIAAGLLVGVLSLRERVPPNSP